MDFHELMNMAASKQDNAGKNKVNWYNRDLPAPKREEKSKPRSEVIKKLLEEKEREKREKEEAIRTEKERKEREERKKNQFRIPKKKSEAAPQDTESFINSLFDDSGVQSDASDKSDTKPQEGNRKVSHSTSSLLSSSKDSSTGNKHENHRDKVDKYSSSSSSHQHKSSSDHKGSSSSLSKHSKDKSGASSQTSTKDERKSYHSSSKEHHSSNHKSSSGSDKRRSDSDRHKSSSGHSSSKSEDFKNSGKTSSSEEHKHHSSSTHSSSKSLNSNLSKSDTKSSLSNSESSSSQVNKDHQSASEKSASTAPQRTASDEQPIVLSKHHLNPVVERHASAPGQMSEREKILAHLQAIKQRTLEAIQKNSKVRRSRGEKSHRKSKGEEKNDDKTKSAEMVHEVASSDDEEMTNSNVPSALDIMLSERNAKLEKEKIARMAKQAWERATRKDTGDLDKETKVKKRMKSSHKNKEESHRQHKSDKDRRKNNHKKKDYSLSPEPGKQASKPKKPFVVRHSGNTVPPPMDFKAILEMAEKKQKDPPKPAMPIPKKKKEEEARPLTQEEKDRIERKKSREYQNWLKFGGKPPAQKGLSDDEEVVAVHSSSYKTNSVNKKQAVQSSISSEKNNAFAGSSRQSFSKSVLDKERAQGKSLSNLNNGSHYSKHKNITVNENVLVCGPAGSSGEEGSPERAQLSGNPFDRIMGQIHEKRRAPHHSRPSFSSKKRRFSDLEEEDSDADSFIDDGDDGETDYSKEIKKMFGYDKNKYKYERDDDLSDMEVNFATIEKEEKRSARLGLQEDLEDIKKEQEELRRKALLKKQMKRK